MRRFDQNLQHGNIFIVLLCSFLIFSPCLSFLPIRPPHTPLKLRTQGTLLPGMKAQIDGEANKKVAVITGGTRGMGFAMARSLARDGYNLVLGYSSNHDTAQKAKEALANEFNIQVEVSGGDLAEVGTVERLFETAKSEVGPPTAWIHNAGLYLGVTTPRTDAAPEEGAPWEEEFEYYQKVYPRTLKRGVELGVALGALRHVVCISSPGCNLNYNPAVGYEFPGQAKASMEFLTRIYAKKLGEK